MNSFIKITKNLRLHEKKNRIIKSGNIYLIYNTFIGYDFEEIENNKEKHRKIFSEKYNYYLGNYIENFLKNDYLLKINKNKIILENLNRSISLNEERGMYYYNIINKSRNKHELSITVDKNSIQLEDFNIEKSYGEGRNFVGYCSKNNGDKLSNKFLINVNVNK